MTDDHKGADDQVQPEDEQPFEKEDTKVKAIGGQKKGDVDAVTEKSRESAKAASESLNGGGSETGGEGDAVGIAKTDKDEKRKPAKKGLLDEPIVIEGKRQRHAVERLAATSSPPSRRYFEAVGSGTSLGDIEFVNAAISKAHNETLKSLHTLCYGSPGPAFSRKKDLRRFNGFSFDEKSSDFEKKKTVAMRLTGNEVNSIAKVLGTERGHLKEDAVMNVLHFLQKPEDKGKKVPATKKRRQSSKSSRKGAKRRKTEKKGKERSVKKKYVKEMDDERDSDRSADVGHSEEEEESSGGEDGEDSKTESKGAAKRSLKKEKSPRKSDACDYKSDKNVKDEPTWGDGGPTRDELDTAINEILRSVDLVNCTMKQMCERIAEKFPNLDMATFKAPLKERVKVALEKMEDS